MLLSATELCELTGKKIPAAQTRALNFMGIEYRRRPDGTLAVSRAHVDALLGGTSGNKVEKMYEIDLNTVR